MRAAALAACLLTNTLFGGFENFSGYTPPADLEAYTDNIQNTAPLNDKYWEALKSNYDEDTWEWMSPYLGKLYTQSVSYGQFTVSQSYYKYGQGSWHGFVLSNVKDTVTAGKDNQFASITGSGYNGSNNYLVFYGDASGAGFANYMGDEGRMDVMGISGRDITGIYITNTTYAYLSMRDGDGFNAAFKEGDWFKLVITGFDSEGNRIGQTDVMLGEGLDLLSDWAHVDILNLIGEGVDFLSFEFAQYKIDDDKTYYFHGVKVPSYFVLGGIETAGGFVPEPAGWAVIFSGLGLCLIAVRRKGSNN